MDFCLKSDGGDSRKKKNIHAKGKQRKIPLKLLQKLTIHACNQIISLLPLFEWFVP
jgi:hypothetical protein